MTVTGTYQPRSVGRTGGVGGITTLILQRLNLKLPRHDVQAQIMSQTMKIMRPMQIPIAVDPVCEQPRPELVELIEDGLLSRSHRPSSLDSVRILRK